MQTVDRKRTIQAPLPSGFPSTTRSYRLSRSQCEGLFILAVVLLLIASCCLDESVQGPIRNHLKDFGSEYARVITHLWIFNPLLYVGAGIIFLLEFLYPADAEQKLLSHGLLQDALWVTVRIASTTLLLPSLVIALKFIFDHYLGFLTITALSKSFWCAQVILAFVVSDFLSWISHIIRHKVNNFWQFHAVHHGQIQLNMLTESRIHPIDDAFSYLLHFVPFFSLGLSIEAIAGFEWFRQWHTRLYHSNIKSNFGILRYVFVTPQSHRIHHSTQLQHRDKNYGQNLSIWDYIFGTQYRNYDEYPQVGVDDQDFPSGRGVATLTGSAMTVVAQLLYPFKTVTKA